MLLWSTPIPLCTNNLTVKTEDDNIVVEMRIHELRIYLCGWVTIKIYNLYNWDKCFKINLFYKLWKIYVDVL